MAKGSGLFIEQFSDQIPFCLDHHHRPKLKKPNMEAESNGLELSTIQFPVNLSCNNNDEDDGKAASSPSDHRERTEMDFFARNEDNKEEHHEQTSTAATSTENKDRVINVNTGLHLLTANTGSDESTVDDGISPNSEDKRSTNTTNKLQAEIKRINRENQQLKDMLNEVTNNYNALQMHLVTLMQQQKHPMESKSERDNQAEKSNRDDNDCKSKHSIVQKGERGPNVPRQFMDLGLAGSPGELALVRRSGSPPDDNHEREGWVPNKAPRFTESSAKINSGSNVDQATEATMRKARVSVRARSEAPMISDGCQWRKYGQKMAKGNPCPRAYYRCTMAGGCPVRKQVQRCAEDGTILVTTYEGTHSHPLPPTAMMMASATSSAARMLLSGSMPSPDGNGFINHPPNFLAYSRSLFPGSPSSVATISASAPFPTVTLDLTQSPNTGNNNNPLQPLFQRPTQSILPAQLFGQPLYNQSRFSGLQVSRQDGMAHNNENNPLADTVTALTTDPNFTAALAAAITSLIGNGGANNSDSNGNHASSHDNNTNGN